MRDITSYEISLAHNCAFIHAHDFHQNAYLRSQEFALCSVKAVVSLYA